MIRNGPFMRQFLDGFYPMRVSLDVRPPPGRLRFAGIAPPEQDGFRVTQDEHRVRVDILFEGRLHTEIRLAPGPRGTAADTPRADPSPGAFRHPEGDLTCAPNPGS